MVLKVLRSAVIATIMTAIIVVGGWGLWKLILFTLTFPMYIVGPIWLIYYISNLIAK